VAKRRHYHHPLGDGAARRRHGGRCICCFRYGKTGGAWGRAFGIYLAKAALLCCIFCQKALHARGGQASMWLMRGLPLFSTVFKRRGGLATAWKGGDALLCLLHLCLLVAPILNLPDVPFSLSTCRAFCKRNGVAATNVVLLSAILLSYPLSICSARYHILQPKVTTLHMRCTRDFLWRRAALLFYYVPARLSAASPSTLPSRATCWRGVARMTCGAAFMYGFRGRNRASTAGGRAAAGGGARLATGNLLRHAGQWRRYYRACWCVALCCHRCRQPRQAAGNVFANAGGLCGGVVATRIRQRMTGVAATLARRALAGDCAVCAGGMQKNCTLLPRCCRLGRPPSSLHICLNINPFHSAPLDVDNISIRGDVGEPCRWLAWAALRSWNIYLISTSTRSAVAAYTVSYRCLTALATVSASPDPLVGGLRPPLNCRILYPCVP